MTNRVSWQKWATPDSTPDTTDHSTITIMSLQRFDTTTLFIVCLWFYCKCSMPLIDCIIIAVQGMRPFWVRNLSSDINILKSYNYIWVFYGVLDNYISHFHSVHIVRDLLENYRFFPWLKSMRKYGPLYWPQSKTSLSYFEFTSLGSVLEIYHDEAFRINYFSLSQCLKDLYITSVIT